MPNNARSFALRYGFAAVTIAVATWARLLLDPRLGLDFPLATFSIAILLTAWYGGFGPAVTAVVLSVLSAAYYIMPPRGSFAIDASEHRVGMVMFVFTSLGTALIGGAMHAALQRAETNAQAMQRQAALIDQTFDAVLVWDWNGPITFWNHGAERLYGIPREEALGRLSHDLLRTRMLGGVAAFVGPLEREGSWEGELEQTIRGGQKITVESRMVLVRAGDHPYVLEANRNITEHRRAEERFRQAVQSAPNGMVMIDPEGKIVLVNCQTEKMFGYRQDELLGQPVEMLVPDRFRGEHPCSRKEFFASPTVRSMGIGRDLHGRRKDGSEFPVEIGLNPINSDKGLLVLSAIVDITLRKKSEEMFRQAMESAPNGMVMINPEGKILLVNAQTEKLFGYGRDELLGESVELLVPERFRAKHPDFRTSFFAHPQVRSMGVGRDLYGRRKNGSEFPVEIGLNPINTQEGLLVLSAIVDITERKRAEADLRDRERLLGIVTGSARVGLVVVGPGYRYLFANEAYADIFGLDAHEIVGRRVPDLLPMGWPQIRPRLDQALAGERIAYELALPPVTGGQRPRSFTVVYEPRMGDGGMPTVVVVVADITDRKRVEEALNERERTLRLFITYAPAAIAMFDCNMAYVSASNRWLTDYDLEQQELSGRSHYELFPEISDRWKDIHRRCLAGATEKCPEEPFRRLDGTVDWLRWEVLPWYKGDGGIGGIIIFSETITQQKMAEEALRQKVAELARSNADLEQFAYIASHDLQEPLRMVGSYTQLLARRYKDKLDQDANDFIDYAVDGAKRMQVLIEDLLAYSRVATRGSSFANTDVEIIVDKALANLQLAIQECQAEVTCGPLPTIQVDAGQLSQVFQNLIGNAIKFHGIEHPRIDIGAVQHGNEWIISVKDNGIGIEPQYFDRLFVIFQRLHTKAEYAGTGIGLALCKKIVLRHGGRIWVESALGKGSTFHFTIPDRGGAA